MTRFTRRAQIREAARMAWVLTECLAVVALVAILLTSGAEAIRSASSITIQTVEAR